MEGPPLCWSAAQVEGHRSAVAGLRRDNGALLDANRSLTVALAAAAEDARRRGRSDSDPRPLDSEVCAGTGAGISTQELSNLSGKGRDRYPRILEGGRRSISATIPEKSLLIQNMSFCPPQNNGAEEGASSNDNTKTTVS